jgi:hypothetical protein
MEKGSISRLEMLLVDIIKDGKRVYDNPEIDDIRNYVFPM